jgi:hypothetical protein
MAEFSFLRRTCNRGWIVKVFVAVLGGLACTASMLAAVAVAGGGKILPPCANPKGYSLSDMAAATAAFNVGPRTGIPPKVPFHVLVADATVKPGTMLYLPVYYADNSPPVPSEPPFPKHIRDQDADADYLVDLLAAYGVEAFIVQVDGKTTILCDDYVAGVRTAPLPDGGGTDYIVCAAFLTPLTPGQHTVGVGGMIGGEPVVFVSYTVTVKP